MFRFNRYRVDVPSMRLSTVTFALLTASLVVAFVNLLATLLTS